MVLAACLAAGSVQAFAQSPTPAGWETVNVVRTNRTSRVITNLIEVRMPANIFVDEYRTNWVTRSVTNLITVEVTRTNLVRVYQTNVAMLTLTNWETVVVFKTNWVKRQTTAVAEVNIPAPAIEAPSAAPPAPAAAPAAAPVASDGLILVATRTSKPPVNNLVEVFMKMRGSSGVEPDFASQEWQLARGDGSVLFGQGSEFRQDISPGTYKIEMTARINGRKNLVHFRRTLKVTRERVTQEVSD